MTTWLLPGVRTPFVRVDGPFKHLDAIALSVPLAQAMAAQARGPIDFGVWGSVAPNLTYSNIAREIWLDAKLDPHVPTFSTIMACSTSMMAAFEAARLLQGKERALAMVGGVESMSRVQLGLGQNLSDGIRRLGQARDWNGRFKALAEIKPHDVRLFIPAVKNRTTGKSMGEHCEEMAKTWQIPRAEQDALALQSHQRAVAAQANGFFRDLIMPLLGVDKDAFPRGDTTLEKLAKLRPVFDRTNGTITAGSSSPLTDGAAAMWVANDDGLARLPASLPRAKLVDLELASVDIARDGLLMAPAFAIPRLLARHGLTYADITLWEIHEAFSAQVLCHLRALDDATFVRERAGVTAALGQVPVERMNPNGGSVALGHPFGATGARILSQAVKELTAMPSGSRAIVSICADGGVGTVALLEV
jgi:acetyl-CoA C-acetyltransferase